MKYRKYLEPVYGEAAPCVRINQPQIMDMDDPAGWRNKANEEGFAAETEAMKQCVCYPGMMRVHTEDLVIRQNGHEVHVASYDRDEHGASARAEHEEGREQPLPEREAAFGIAEARGAVYHGIARGVDGARVLAGRKGLCKDKAHDHQGEYDRY